MRNLRYGFHDNPEIKALARLLVISLWALQIIHNWIRVTTLWKSLNYRWFRIIIYFYFMNEFVQCWTNATFSHKSHTILFPNYVHIQNLHILSEWYSSLNTYQFLIWLVSHISFSCLVIYRSFSQNNFQCSFSCL